MANELTIGKLKVKIHDDRIQMGADAAKMVITKITDLLSRQQEVNMIFAAAPSQNEFLDFLSGGKDVDKKDLDEKNVDEKDVEWNRVNAFHMDEYLGLSEKAPQGFGNFLKERLFDKLPFRTVNYLKGNAADPLGECRRYAELLSQYPADIVCMGIGENTHIAFNDPHVADFNDKQQVKIVDLDEACRQQQVNDGCFGRLEDVPARALTLTIPALLGAACIYCMVPGKNKAQAVYYTLREGITEKYPSTILRTHKQAILFLDKNSASMLDG